jgi:cation-transporting ATPase 13A1
LNSILAVTFVAFAAATEMFPSLNESLELVTFGDAFRFKLITTMVLDFGVAWLIEMVCLTLFSDNRAKASLFPKR